MGKQRASDVGKLCSAKLSTTVEENKVSKRFRRDSKKTPLIKAAASDVRMSRADTTAMIILSRVLILFVAVWAARLSLQSALLWMYSPRESQWSKLREKMASLLLNSSDFFLWFLLCRTELGGACNLGSHLTSMEYVYRKLYTTFGVFFKILGRAVLIRTKHCVNKW